MRLVAWLAVGTLWIMASGARADDLPGPSAEPTEAQVEQARALYRAGNAAASNGEYGDALPFFARSYLLSGNPAALYNAARTLRSLGRHAAARRAFAQLLALGDLDAQLRAEATALMADEAGRVAELTLEGLPPAGPDLVLHLDGALETDVGDRPLVLELDAGEHGLVVDRPGYLPFRWDARLIEGARVRARVEFAPLSGRSLAEEPVLWVIVGLVVVSGAVVGGVLGWDAAQLRPDADPDTTVIRL